MTRGDTGIKTNDIGNDHINDENNPLSELRRKITLAKGQKMVDLVVKNANLVNVLSGQIYQTDVGIVDDYIVGLGEGYQAKYTIDANGQYLSPGLIDGHIHIESTFLSPKEFSSVVSSHGTSAVICDPHEIANVIGLRGIDYVIHSSIGLPVKIFVMIPSCVPTTHMETSGTKITGLDIREYVGKYPGRVIGLAEMMNYPGVLSEDTETLSKLIAVGHMPKDGHAPLLTGKPLNAYVVAGLTSDHECSVLSEATEKLQKGLHIMIRQGTHEKNLKELIPLVNEFNSNNISLISDDRDAIDLKNNGHMDYLVRSAISYGLDPMRAIQMASINTARYFGISDLGAVAPGFKADFILLENLDTFKISKVFLNGKQIPLEEKDVQNRTALSIMEAPNNVIAPQYLENTMFVKPTNDAQILTIPAKPGESFMRVIGVTPGQIITDNRIIEAKIDNMKAVADKNRGIAKLAVFERHHGSGNVGLGFVQGLGLERGSIASSVAHDSHNLIVAGMNDVDMLVAAKFISSIGGGLAVVDNGKIMASLSLPIAGLISNQNIDSVISDLTSVNLATKKLGTNTINDPFMLLSFLSLPVITSLKLTDKGLVDVEKFQIVELWVN
jgi:adenine deaminase